MRTRSRTGNAAPQCRVLRRASGDDAGWPPPFGAARPARDSLVRWCAHGHPLAYQACRYDASDIPFAYYAQFADGPHIADYSRLAQDVAQKTLPSFAYVKALTTRNEHPNVSNITDGIAFVQGVIQTISQSSYASSTLIVPESTRWSRRSSAGPSRAEEPVHTGELECGGVVHATLVPSAPGLASARCSESGHPPQRGQGCVLNCPSPGATSCSTQVRLHTPRAR